MSKSRKIGAPEQVLALLFARQDPARAAADAVWLAGLVRSWLLSVVNHQNLDGSFTGLQIQTELLL